MPGGSLRGFAEKVTIVVGAGAGLAGVGRAVALQCAMEGAYVIVSHRADDAEAARVANTLREMGTLAHAVGVDVRDAEDVERLFERVAEIYGRLDLLVFVADANLGAMPLDDLIAEQVDEVLSNSVRAAVLCTRAAVPLMRGRPKAGMVYVGAGAKSRAAEAAAKAGFVGLTEPRAAELAPRVRVNCVTVGTGARGVVPNSGGASGNATGTDAPPLAADEAARACLYLLSPEARFVTGQTLLVGGK